MLVRRCHDRLHKMLTFLKAQGILWDSYLDLGCSYGWFVAQMQGQCSSAIGVDRDPGALDIGRTVYKLSDRQLVRADCARFVTECERHVDVVSCFSVLHHMINAPSRMSPEEFVKRVDRCTARCLFFEMGHESEHWYRQRLAGWNRTTIARWLKANTSFDQIIDLGCDEDGVNAFKGNFGRALFACVRK